MNVARAARNWAEVVCRGVLRRAVVVAVTGFALNAGGAGCASFTPPAREPMRIGTMDDLPAEALGLHEGVTTVDEARAAMAARGLTGIVSDTFAPASAPALAVIGADYQRHLFVFRGGRYHQRLALPPGGLPYGLVVRLGGDARGPVLLVVERDPLGRRGAPPALLTYRWGSDDHRSDVSVDDDPYGASPGRGGFVAAEAISLAAIARRHGGMLRPILVGAELDEGILLLARDERGMVWDEGYLVRMKDGTTALDAMPWATAMRCSCVQKYSLEGL